MRYLIALIPFFLYCDADITPQRIRASLDAADTCGHVITSLVNTHLDKLRFLEAIDPFKSEQFSFHSAWTSSALEFGNKFLTNTNPKAHITEEAVLCGIDRRNLSLHIFGFTVGYIHSYFNQDPRADQGTTNGGVTALYSSISIEHFYIESAFWGIYQSIKNKRNIITDTILKTGIASIPIWEIEPHLELGINFDKRIGRFTPFVNFDYLYTWQGSYTETGAGIYDASQNSYQCSTLKTELGYKFHQFWEFSWGLLLSRQKIYTSLNKSFLPAAQMFEHGIHRTFIAQSDYTFTPFFCFSIDISPSIGKRAPLDIRISYDGKFTYNRMSNKLELLISKIF